MRRPLVAVFLFWPLFAQADNHCAFQAPRTLHADLAGVHSLRVEVNGEDLHVVGNPNATALDMDGRACAANADLLDKLQVRQHREGDQLVLELIDDNHGSFFGGYSTDLDIRLSVPASLPVELAVGSGDADVSDMAQVSGHVGSGDLHVSRVASVHAVVGSGDIGVKSSGRLQVDAVGSGDLKVSDMSGDVDVGTVGSGDAVIAHVDGNVRVQTLGSGDLQVKDVRGDFSLGAKGSGDVSHADIHGKVSVPRDTSDD